MDWIYQSSDPILETLAGIVLMFTAVVVITRIVGLRSFAKFSTFDFAFTVATGSAISATLTSSTTVVHGATTVFGLLILTAIVAYLQREANWFNDLISNKPLLLMDGAEILEDNLKAARVSKSQLIAKLREANVLKLDQVRAVVLETTGDISVLHVSEDANTILEKRLLEGVRRNP